MRHTLTFIAGLLVLNFFPSAFAAGTQRPIEVLSDPYGVGSPTQYSVIRGSSKITFSHPINGQFSRAEITTRSVSSSKTTRFLLSADGSTYLPSLQLDAAFEKHFSLKDEINCPSENSKPNYFTRAFADKIVDSETIAKTREMLTKAKFFDSSCSGAEFGKDHGMAVKNAMADVLEKTTQDTQPEPKFLRCLEKYGHAHEAGIIEAFVKQSVSSSDLNPRIRISCSAASESEAGSFDEKTKTIKLSKAAKADREAYGGTIFHELLHAAPIQDGTKLKIMEDCCSYGEQCDVLKMYADQKKSGERNVTIAESIDPRNSVATGVVTTLKGPDQESAAFGKANNVLAQFEKSSLTLGETPQACKLQGEAQCRADTLRAISSVSSMMSCPVPKSSTKTSMVTPWNQDLVSMLLFPRAYADTSEISCNSQPVGTAALKQAIESTQARTVAELSEKYAPVGPITFDKPLDESVPVRMAISDDAQTAPLNATTKPRTPTRTIASISPLPDEKPERRMGSANNRNDVGGGRATFLVDTLEKAALKVTVTLTQEKLNQLAVNKDDIFKKDFKAKSASPHYIVTSSVAKPLQVADIGDIKGLGFPNPFANAKNISANAPAPASAKNAKALAKTLADEPTSASASSGPAATTPSNNSIIAQGSQAKLIAPSRQQKTPDRAPSSTKTNFKTMDHPALVKFLTASYRTVSGELENPDFISALANNGIQIIDHENRRIGATKPTATFIYRSDLSRLVQTRAHR